MRLTPPALLPVLRSKVVGDLLALILLDPMRRWTVQELAERAGSPYPTVARELRRLAEAGLVISETVGRSHLLRANEANPYVRPLRELVTMAFGPPRVLAEEFAAIAGIEELLIFGSFAARSSGIAGPPPVDIDVLVLGHADRDEVYEAARRSEQRLGRPVNTTMRPLDDWATADDGFARQVKSSPVIAVEGPWSAYAAGRGEVAEG